MSSYRRHLTFEELRDRCLREGRLYEDPEFPATSRSVYFSKHDPYMRWKRPGEICRKPKFIVDGASRFDLDQGSIGNCWYIAAAATLAATPELFKQVVPIEQTFTHQYAGIFRFRFWRFGKWIEVIIDDRLPVGALKGGLKFCQNREEPDEFWAALLEKAYSKIHGSYEALEGGWTEDAYVDFTGGVGHRRDLKDRKKTQHLFTEMLHNYKMNTLMACSISATADTMEHTLSNGLVIGHAYSITKVARIEINRQKVQLLRIRNPWGQGEWNGPWSDKSREWRSVDNDTRAKLGLISEQDGEFFISFDDFITNFEELQCCYLPPGRKMKMHEPTEHFVSWNQDWALEEMHGSWVKGVSAGGCGNSPYRSLYWDNPQYVLDVTLPDKDDEDKKCTIIISVMQKHARAMRSEYKVQNANRAMSFSLYKVRGNKPPMFDEENYTGHELIRESSKDTYQYYREVTHMFHLDPGVYVVIPSLFEPFVEMEFLLRTFTEAGLRTSENDIPTGPITKPRSSPMMIEDLFQKYAGADGVIDARELQGLLNDAFYEDLGEQHKFGLDTSRSLLAMNDIDQSGVLEVREVQKMWTELKTWQGVFRTFDKDKTGFVEVKELRSIFKSIGYSVSKKVLKSIVRRYGGKEEKLSFDDFIMVITKMMVLMDVFAKRSKDGLKGTAKFDFDDFMQVAIYF